MYFDVAPLDESEFTVSFVSLKTCSWMLSDGTRFGYPSPAAAYTSGGEATRGLITGLVTSSSTSADSARAGRRPATPAPFSADKRRISSRRLRGMGNGSNLRVRCASAATRRAARYAPLQCGVKRNRKKSRLALVVGAGQRQRRARFSNYDIVISGKSSRATQTIAKYQPSVAQCRRQPGERGGRRSGIGGIDERESCR